MRNDFQDNLGRFSCLKPFCVCLLLMLAGRLGSSRYDAIVHQMGKAGVHLFDFLLRHVVVGLLSMKIVVSSRFVVAIFVDSMSVALAAEVSGHKQGQIVETRC